MTATKNNCNLEFYTVKLSFKHEREIKTFSNKIKLRAFFRNTSAL